MRRMRRFRRGRRTLGIPRKLRTKMSYTVPVTIGTSGTWSLACKVDSTDTAQYWLNSGTPSNITDRDPLEKMEGFYQYFRCTGIKLFYAPANPFATSAEYQDLSAYPFWTRFNASVGNLTRGSLLETRDIATQNDVYNQARSTPGCRAHNMRSPWKRYWKVRMPKAQFVGTLGGAPGQFYTTSDHAEEFMYGQVFIEQPVLDAITQSITVGQITVTKYYTLYRPNTVIGQ